MTRQPNPALPGLGWASGQLRSPESGQRGQVGRPTQSRRIRQPGEIGPAGHIRSGSSAPQASRVGAARSDQPGGAGPRQAGQSGQVRQASRSCQVRWAGQDCRARPPGASDPPDGQIHRARYARRGRSPVTSGSPGGQICRGKQGRRARPPGTSGWPGGQICRGKQAAGTSGPRGRAGPSGLRARAHAGFGRAGQVRRARSRVGLAGPDRSAGLALPAVTSGCRAGWVRPGGVRL
jgi:hypothetical protein